MAFLTGLQRALELRQREVVSELRRGDSLEEVLNRHLLTVERMSDIEILTSILLLSSDGKRLTHGAAPSLPRPYVDAINGSEIGPSAGSCGTAAYFGRPVYVTNIATDPLWANYRDLALPHGLLSCWSTPIRNSDGSVLGTFAIYHRNLSGPTKDELNMIEIITANVARALAWARDPDAPIQAFDLLPRRIAALEALVAAISEEGSVLEPDGQAAIEAIAAETRTLVTVVRRQLGELDEAE